MGMIFVLARSSPRCLEQIAFGHLLRPFLSWPTRKLYAFEHPFEQVFWLCAEETLRRCRSIRALDKIVMHGRQRFELVVADPVQTMMAQRQMPVSSLDTGTGSLEEMGTV